MLPASSQIAALLRRLAQSHAQSPLPEVQRILAAVLDADEARLVDSRGRGLPDGLTLAELLEHSFDVSVRFHCRPAVPGRDDAPRTHEAPVSSLSEEEKYERFLYEFDRLEHRHGFMWAGYIVRELLPRLGYSPEEAKLTLDRLRTEGILKMSKVANPRNPEFPATGVHLNREHPRVKAFLQSSNGTSETPPPTEVPPPPM